MFWLNGYWVLVICMLLNRLRETYLLVIILGLLCVVSVVRCHCLPLLVVHMSLSLMYPSLNKLNKNGLKSSAPVV